MTPSAWISQFLRKRNLNKPDGRSLFGYKVTATEYGELIDVLKSNSIQGTAYYAQAWLLYAAEWWKREYAGGAWGWQPIVSPICIQDISHNEIKELVISGHFQWRLPPIRSGGRRFIGVVVINGGLPLRLLETAHGRVTNLLKGALRQVIKYRLASDQLRAQIMSQAGLLPTTYQQEPIFDLLEAVGQTVLSLRDDYQLSAEDNPVDKLDQACPAWSSRFPIALEGDAARGMIRELIGTTNEQPLSSPFQFMRGIRFSSDGSAPIFDASFDALAKVQIEQLKDMFDVQGDDLPADFQILLCAQGNQTVVAKAFRRGQEYQIVKQPSSLRSYAQESVELVISRWGSTLFTTDLPNGDELEKKEPLVFQDTEPFARLIARGDASVKGYSALVLIPTDAQSQTVCTDCISSIDQRMLVRLPEGEHIINCGDEAYSIRISTTQIGSPETFWIGKTIDALSKPGPIFVGQPRLKLQDDLGNRTYIPSHEVLVNTHTGEQPLQRTLAPGLCRLIVRRNGQRLVNARAVILGEKASISYASSDNAFEGTIRLHNWPSVRVSTATANVTVENLPIEQTLELRVRCMAQQPVDTVTLNLAWPSGNQKLTLPFPTDRVAVFRGNNLLKNGIILALDDLPGCRALLPSGHANELWRLRLSTSIDHGDTLSQEIPYWGAREIRLFELRAAIEQLLSCNPGLDHRVTLEILNQHNTRFSLQIGRYSAWLDADYRQNTVAIQSSLQSETLDDSESEGLITALPWTEPTEEPITLPLRYSENVFTGEWAINLPMKSTGSWILFTPQKQIRPTVISVGSLVALNASPLQRALSQGDPILRMECLNDALQLMTNDLMSSDWDLLDNLLNRLGHLPLSSLDVCHALIAEPSALTLAALYLGDFSSDLIERLPAEMPFEWLLINPSHWFDAMQKIHGYASSHSPRYLELTRQTIERKTSLLAQWQPAMQFIFDQGFHIIFKKKTQDVRFFINNPDALVNLRLNELFGGQENSQMQQLFHRHSADQLNPYPALNYPDLQAFIATKQGRELLSLTRLQPDSYQLSVVLLPFMVAFDAHDNRSDKWRQNSRRLFTLRSVRLFDAIWFEAAYEAGLIMACADELKEKRNALSKRLHQQTR